MAHINNGGNGNGPNGPHDRGWLRKAWGYTKLGVASLLFTNAGRMTLLASPLVLGIAQCTYQQPQLHPLDAVAIDTATDNALNNYKWAWNHTAQPLLHGLGALGTPNAVDPDIAAQSVLICRPKGAYKSDPTQVEKFNREHFIRLDEAQFDPRARRFYINQDDQIKAQFNHSNSQVWDVINSGQYARIEVDDYNDNIREGWGKPRLVPVRKHKNLQCPGDKPMRTFVDISTGKMPSLY